MIYSFQEFLDVLPLIIIAIGIVISVVIEMYKKESEGIIAWLTIFVFLAAAFYSLLTIENTSVIFQGMVATGGNVNIFYFIFNFGAAIVTLLSMDYIKKYGTNYGEFYILVKSAVLGMMVMAAAKDLFMIFLGLELMSVCFYVLAGINRKKEKAIEASLKYFLLGAFATGFIVYGIALIYGSTETTSLEIITSGFSGFAGNIIFVIGVLLFLIGFSFKIAAFPFHMWVPDVYQGAATTVTGLMSTAGKTAAFSAIIVSLAALFYEDVVNIFQPYLAVIAVLSMLYGSIVALAQNDLKRMLAYSSIAHAGYMAIGLAAGNPLGVAGIIYYLAAYTFMNLAAFGIIALIEGENDSNLDIHSYSGLGNKKPILAGLFSLIMFALAGIPPLAGFFGKYYVFIAAINADLVWLAVVGVLSSVISVYFYLRVIVFMYFKDSEGEIVVQKSNTGLLGIIISVLLVIVLGLLPGTLIDLITAFLK